MWRGCGQRGYVREQNRCGVDGNRRRLLMPLLLQQPHTIERVERSLLAASVFAELRVLRCGRLRTPDNLLARKAAEEPSAGHRRSGDDRQ